MLHIVSYKNPCGLEIAFFFNPADGFLYRQEEGESGLKVMGRPENFVFPNVPKPQDMNTHEARKLTIFCKDWLINHPIRQEKAS